MSALITESSRPGKAGLSQSPLRAGLEAGPLALTFSTMSILGPRLAARFGPWSITIGAGLDVVGTIGLVLTGLRYGGHLTGWDLAPEPAVAAAPTVREPAEYSAGAAH